MTPRTWLVIVIISAGIATIAAGPDQDRGLPRELVDYRSWSATAEPSMIPFQLAMDCTPTITPGHAQELEKTYGPHAMRWVRVYANAPASAAMRSTDALEFPVGSIIAKEKLRDPSDKTPEGVAFMIKRGGGKFEASGGWEFLYYPSTETTAESYDGCITCHRIGGKRDYVFGVADRASEP